MEGTGAAPEWSLLYAAKQGFSQKGAEELHGCRAQGQRLCGLLRAAMQGLQSCVHAEL